MFPTVPLDPDTLQEMKTTKLLGVTIDDELTWKTHVTTVTKTAIFRLYLLRRVKSMGEILCIYKIFILPKLTYASSAWSPSLAAN